MPATFEAERLMVCEVVTPGGNWSSYPPHKHDEELMDETELEEIYYFEVGSSPTGQDGFAFQRVYGTAERPIDLLAEVRQGDVVLIPHGYHGPSIAAPGYDLYYLNVMAGPGDRAWLATDDPAHAWVRATWADQPVDPRLARPMPGWAMPGWRERRQGRRTMSTVRLTVAQATVRFLAQQHSERDGQQHRLVEGCFGIFGHGNVAGLGEALLEAELDTPGALVYRQARNEQGMVHAAVAFARMRNRLSTLACTSSIGPGATNMVTGAALATINRLPVLLLPGDLFATRIADPVLQQLEHLGFPDVSVNDTFRPVSRFFDRVERPEQLPDALLGAMRVLSDPAETGAVTVCFPQDVQTEAFDWPAELFAPRTWHVDRPVPDPAAMARARDALLSARRPLIVAGGGVIYSEATDALRAFAEATGIPVAETQAGKGSLPYDHAQAVGAVGSTGSTAANALASQADVVLGIGTRWTDFTTASRTAFGPGAKFINCNIVRFDAAKNAGIAVVGDARTTRGPVSGRCRRLVRRPLVPGRVAPTGQGMGRHGGARLQARAPAAPGPVRSNRGGQRGKRTS